MSKYYAYLRVSKDEQDLDKFHGDILRFANERKFVPVEFIEEKISGKVPWEERKIFSLVQGLEKEDVLLVPEISRLSRTMYEIMEILGACTRKGARVYAIKEKWALDDTLQSKVFAAFFSIFAQVERDLISRRTEEALRAKKATGFKLGRPAGTYSSKLDKFAEEIELFLANGTTKSYIAKKYGVSRGTLNSFLSKRGKKCT